MNLRLLFSKSGYRRIKDDDEQVGIFGKIYTQFNGNLKGAIDFLKQVQGGECVNVLYKKGIGYISLIWGNEGTKEKAYLDGFGLSHIIKAHENELKQLGVTIEGVIQKLLKDGKVKHLNDREILEADGFRMVIKTKYDNIEKTYVHTAYDLRPIRLKNAQRASQISEIKKGN